MGLGNGGGFYYYDGDLNHINNDQFGTCTIESLDPLTSPTRINEGVTWSDGVQIDAADMLLYVGRAERSASTTPSRSIAPDGTTAKADADGNPIIVDASGAVGDRPTPPFDPETDDAARGLHLQGVGRRRVRRRRAKVADARHRGPRDLRGRPGPHGDVRHVLRRLPDRRRHRRHVPAHVVGRTRPRHRGPGRGQAGDHRRLHRTTTRPRSSRSPSSGTPASTPPACRTTRACT